MWPFILEKVEAATEGMQKVAVGGVLNVAEAMQRLTAGQAAAAVAVCWQPPGNASDVLDQPHLHILAMQRPTRGRSGRCVVYAHSLMTSHYLPCNWILKSVHAKAESMFKPPGQAAVTFPSSPAIGSCPLSSFMTGHARALAMGPPGFAPA